MLQRQRRYASEDPAIGVFGDVALAIAASNGLPSSSGLATIADRWAIVADARIDNRDDLRRSIGSGELAGASDATLILHAWARWGEDCLQAIAGDFAFVISDLQSGKVSLVRDPAGERPLFYSLSGNAFFFASMPSGFGAQALEPDFETVALWLRNQPPVGSASFFKGIERVLPGEVAQFQGGRLSRRTWWDPDLRPWPYRPDDDVQEYRQLLDQAVQSRLPRDANAVAAHLSSGLDSSAVTATAARLLPDRQRLIGFTAAPRNVTGAPPRRGLVADESEIAAKTAAFLGIRHRIEQDTPPLFEAIERHIHLAQGPPGDAFNMLWVCGIRNAARDVGAKTMLTGELGNLSLNPGGLANLATYLQAGRWPQWWNEAKASLRRSDVRLRGVLMNSFWPWMPEAGETFLKRRFLGVSGAPETTFLCPEWLRWSQAAPRPLRVRDSAALRLQMIRRHEVGTVRKAAIADAGVEELDPMADRRLIEFGLRLPPEHLFRDGVARPLARTALADRLPASVLQSSTRGLQGADWFTKISRESASQALETISSSARVKDLLDIAALKAAIDSWPQGDWNSAACVTKYRTGLTRALSAGLFIKSLEHAA